MSRYSINIWNISAYVTVFSWTFFAHSSLVYNIFLPGTGNRDSVFHSKGMSVHRMALFGY